MHFEYIASATSNGIMQVSIETLVPCIFGVLTVLDKPQAIARSTGTGNEGLAWGRSAVEMGLNRMSAFGMSGGGGAKSEGDSKAAPLVTFDATAGGATKNATSEKKSKKFGF